MERPNGESAAGKESEEQQSPTTTCVCHESVTEADKEALRRDLGFVPSNLYMVMRRHADTLTPQACVMYPLSLTARQGKLEPFPTICWLTCATLKARVSVFEESGWVKIFEEKLFTNLDSYGKAMVRAHNMYAKQRTALLNDADRLVVAAKGWDRALCERRGVAGITNGDATMPTVQNHDDCDNREEDATGVAQSGGPRIVTTWEISVKCLHAHLAHYLCYPDHGNVVGRWTWEALEENKDVEILKERKANGLRS